MALGPLHGQSLASKMLPLELSLRAVPHCWRSLNTAGHSPLCSAMRRKGRIPRDRAIGVPKFQRAQIVTNSCDGGPRLPKIGESRLVRSAFRKEILRLSGLRAGDGRIRLGVKRSVGANVSLCERDFAGARRRGFPFDRRCFGSYIIWCSRPHSNLPAPRSPVLLQVRTT
jgi:hypothetical protein